jgi:ribose/xylose/arabinose/galactoside ABC-type transport system permease subunit
MVGPIPIVFIYLVVMVAVLSYFFYFKPFGWRLFAIGLNDGVIVGSYLAVGSVLIGPPYLLPILAGAFIGGISLAGGEGSPFGAVLGGYTVYLIENIIVVLAIAAFWKEVVIGLFLLFFVIFEFYRRKKAAAVLI